MNDELRERIKDRLRGDSPLTAGEVAFFLHTSVHSVQLELRLLVQDREVMRHHMPSGTLRYSLIEDTQLPPMISETVRLRMTRLIEYIDRVARMRDASLRLTFLEIIGARIGKHIEDAMLEADIARARQETTP